MEKIMLDINLPPFRVLSLDGGGMRGIYTATYLERVSAAFAKKRNVTKLDIGKAFDLIIGTSTGGLIACALAANRPLINIVDLYREVGPKIFSKKIPSSVGILTDIFRRPRALKSGNEAFRAALIREFDNTNLRDIYYNRGIRLAIPAVEMSQHRSWVFKTPHSSGTSGRDDFYSLVDVCLATSAAPIYRSMAAIDHPENTSTGYNVFVDGGLWANNPVLVGLIEALDQTVENQKIHIFALGTCPVPAGEQIAKTAVNRGLREWKFGGEAASLSIDAQQFAFDNMARMLARHVKRDVRIIRFPAEKVPAALIPYLGLDEISEAGIQALINQARTDADMTNSKCSYESDPDAELICGLFNSAPVIS